jgi:hypothetical protein
MIDKDVIIVGIFLFIIAIFTYVQYGIEYSAGWVATFLIYSVFTFYDITNQKIINDINEALGA